MFRYSGRLILGQALALLMMLASCSRQTVDPTVQRATIQNVGSDSRVIVALVWAERFSGEDSNPAVAVSGGGSGTGIAGLIDGTVDIANATRRLKPLEISTASEAGFTSFETIVGFDAPAFIVHPDNPTDSLTAHQLAEILGEDGSIEVWSQLGISVPGCPSDEIVRISRQSSVTKSSRAPCDRCCSGTRSRTGWIDPPSSFLSRNSRSSASRVFYP